MAHALVKKQNIADQALDDGEMEVFIAPEITTNGTPKAGGGTKSRIEKLADKLDDSHVATISSALQLLAGMCDGARMEDGAGFNKIDSRIGKELAASPGLTKKQAALGYTIAKKYNRTQLGGILDKVAESLK